jgi:hypothetical protein
MSSQNTKDTNDLLASAGKFEARFDYKIVKYIATPIFIIFGLYNLYISRNYVKTTGTVKSIGINTCIVEFTVNNKKYSSQLNVDKKARIILNQNIVIYYDTRNPNNITNYNLLYKGLFSIAGGIMLYVIYYYWYQAVKKNPELARTNFYMS